MGIQLKPEAMPARDVCERLIDMGVLAKDTHETTVRLAPPLCVSEEDLEWADRAHPHGARGARLSPDLTRKRIVPPTR